MLFISPIWLLALLPWAGVSLYLLWGRRQKVGVPFLRLWEIPDTPPPPRRWLQLPPWGVVLLLLAMLLAIVAAAGPQLALGAPRPPAALTVILDRGITMSARGEKDLRYRELTRDLAEALARIIPGGMVDLVAVPGAEQAVTVEGLPGIVSGLGPAAIETRQAVGAEVHRRLAGGGVVLVVSDGELAERDPRVIQVAPTRPAQNVGLVAVAFRAWPRPQLMLRVRNDSALDRAQVRVQSDERPEHHFELALPRAGGEKALFVDLPEAGRVVRVGLEVRDDLDFDNSAWLVQSRQAPRIEAGFSLPPELARLVEAYQHLSPPEADARRLLVVRDAAELPADQIGVVLPPPQLEGVPGPITVMPHPLTAVNMDWQALAKGAGLAESAGSGWAPLVYSGRQILLAVRELPARQAWVGFDARALASTTTYPIFWKKVIDYVGGVEDAYQADEVALSGAGWRRIDPPPSQREQDWSPGLYQGPRGEVHAFNALDVKFGPMIDRPWREPLAALGRRWQAGWPLATGLLLGSLGLAALSAWVWFTASGVTGRRTRSRTGGIERPA